MKKILFAVFILTLNTAFADTAQNPAANPGEIPTAEKAFVDSINGFDKAQIRAQFGEPAKIEDIKTESESMNASIWHYHHLNTNDKGEYYETTELDFIDDRVVTVVFMNNDGTEISNEAKVSAPATPTSP
jgi:hypothetical protein